MSAVPPYTRRAALSVRAGVVAPTANWPWLAAVVAAFVALAAAYSVAVPAYETNDEPWHYTYVRVLALGRGLPVQRPGDARYVPGEGHQPPLYYLLAAPVLKLSGLAPYEVVAVENPDPLRRPNRYLHPVPGEDFPYAAAVRGLHLVRLVSIALGALALVCIYLAAREALPAYPHVPVAIAARALLVVIGRHRQRLFALWPAMQRWALLVIPLASAAIAIVVLVGKVAPAYATAHC